jgi:hypothetical protein
MAASYRPLMTSQLNQTPAFPDSSPNERALPGAKKSPAGAGLKALLIN